MSIAPVLTIANELRGIAVEEHDRRLDNLADELDELAEIVDDVRYQEYGGAPGCRLGMKLREVAVRLGKVTE